MTLLAAQASVALVGRESVIWIVSSVSSLVSLTIGNFTVCTVSPALNVTEPLASVKSDPPPVAVPPVTAYLTVTTDDGGVASAIWDSAFPADSKMVESTNRSSNDSIRDAIKN